MLKFARFVYKNKEMCNIGDSIQLLAVNNLYKEMGIPGEDIVDISNADAATYDGDYVILPVNMLISDYLGDRTLASKFSERIIPVFLGISLYDDKLTDDNVKYFQKYQPIGCRDERALGILRKHGIDSFLNGCITLTYAKVDIDRSKNKKIFFVDTSEHLNKYIPQEIMKDAVFSTHVYRDIEDPFAKTIEVYNQYIHEAKYVVTTRLHCAAPCIAAGIPVVLAVDSISYRFAWLDKFIKIYSKEEYGDIDWNPKAIDFEDIKKEIIQNDINLLNDAYNKYNNKYAISSFFESRHKNTYKLDYVEYLHRRIQEIGNRNAEFEYAIWGLTQYASFIQRFIAENYPKAKLRKVYDMREAIALDGVLAESPQNIQNDNLIIFVLAQTARKIAWELFNEMGRPENSYVIIDSPNK